MRSPLAGRTRIPLAILLATGAAVLVAPASAIAAESVPAPVSILSPSEGETVADDPVLRWTESDGAGYEVHWNAGGALDDTGALDPADGGGRAFPGSRSHQLSDLVAPTYYWQVRALPDGAWSPVAVFHLDIQLDTLGVPPVDAATTPEPAGPAEAGGQTDRPALGHAVSGFVWIAAASTFAGLLLAVVGREWLRLRRQES